MAARDSRPDGQRLMDAFEAAIFVKNREHRWIMVNDALCELVGRPREQLLNKSDYEIFPSEQADVFWRKDEVIFTTNRESIDEDTALVRPGDTRVLQITRTPFVDSKGSDLLIGVIRDATAERGLAEELRIKSSLLEALNEASNTGTLVVADHEGGRIISANHRFREMWGLGSEVQKAASDEVAIQMVLERVEDPEAFTKRIRYLYDHKDEAGRDELLLRDGRIFERYTSPLRGPTGEYYGRAWHFRDITELRKLESLRAEVRQKQALANLKDEFLGTVSHEMRTPLAIVMTAIDSLRRGLAGELTDKQQEVADLCQRNILRLHKMISNLLDISRLEAGTARARMNKTDMRELLADFQANLRLTGRGKDVKIEIDVAESLPDVRADPDMIAQVLDVLIDNAERFAASSARVTARPARGVADGREVPGVRVDVSDDGPGIPLDRMDLLFSKFTQVARGVGGGYKGTGLGLAICKEILALHGSSIAVDRTSTRGARFHFFVPAWAEARVPAQQPHGGQGRSSRHD